MDFCFNSCKDGEELKWKCSQFLLKAFKFCQGRAQVTGGLESWLLHRNRGVSPRNDYLHVKPSSKLMGSQLWTMSYLRVKIKGLGIRRGRWWEQQSCKEPGNLKSCPEMAALSLQANYYDLCHRYIMWLYIVMGRDSAASSEGHYDALGYLVFVQRVCQFR